MSEGVIVAVGVVILCIFGVMWGLKGGKT